MIPIKQIWDDQEVSSKDGVLRHHLSGISSIRVFLGTVVISKTKVLILEVSGTREQHQNHLKKFRGVELQWLPKNDSKGEIVLLLTEPSLINIFTMLVEDVANELLSTRNEVEALTAFYSVITNWRRIFDRIRAPGLSLNQQVGLYGELLIMDLLLQGGLPPISVLNAWTGPERANKDFSWTSCSIEVKSSISNRPALRITNEFQLDRNPGENLWVALVSLGTRPGKDNTLPELVNQHRLVFENNWELTTELESKLSEVGYQFEDEDLYSNLSYSIRNIKFFSITDEFPKLTSKNLPDSVFEVSYAVDISECNSFITESTSIIKTISTNE